MSEIHGMAQRGGVVESAIVFGDAQSNIIADGEADVVVGFEPLETLRALNKCNADTIVITSLAPLSPSTAITGTCPYPELKKLQAIIRSKTAKLIAFDAAALAAQTGNVLAVNMVLLGALIQTGTIPLTVDNVKTAITTISKQAFAASNLEAFELGFDAAKTSD